MKKTKGRDLLQIDAGCFWEEDRRNRLSHQTCWPAKMPLTVIAICNIIIADCNMKRGEKIRDLREVEGALRGLDREMTQQEVVRAIKKEQRGTISQLYLSQIEGGSRPHLTNSTRLLLAKFFKVHPGYLVDDPEG